MGKEIEHIDIYSTELRDYMNDLFFGNDKEKAIAEKAISKFILGQKRKNE